MHIVFAASECAPFAKTGGLADVVAALPKALVALGHQVTTYVPYFRSVSRQLPDLPVAVPSISIPFPTYNRFVRVLNGGVHDGVQIYFLDCPEMFDREGFYGTLGGDYPDNGERFGLFSRGVLEASKAIGIPDIFHAHDWQAAMVPVFLRSTYYFDPLLRKIPCVFTVHNAAYQGASPAAVLSQLLLPAEMFAPDRLQLNGAVNFLKGGLVYADALTTVSRRYAEEIQTAEFGSGLQDVFYRRREDLTGILNGVDYTEWEPSRDTHIAAHYSADDIKGKRECRRDLLHAFDLEGVEDSTALLGIVSRFASQKGFDLLEEIVEQLVQEDVVLLALGTGEEYYERLFTEIAARHPGKVRVEVRYDDTNAHKVIAGSDMFLMPSRYEPCGLDQIYSLRYGTVPVVRATGGLDDTVIEVTDGEGDGFKFSEYTGDAFLRSIRLAVTAFKDKPAWKAIQQRGMAKNFSWESPAEEYVQVYKRSIQRRS